MPVVVERQGWSLHASVERDIDELMTWFPDKQSIVPWGGPFFRYPFNRHSFFEDVHWNCMASFSLRDPGDAMVAFGQVYERFARINLARLVTKPALRGSGVGKRLVGMLMTAGRSRFACPEYALFGFRENLPAYNCYESMGFTMADYPEGAPLADECYYLTRPLDLPTTTTRKGDIYDD